MLKDRGGVLNFSGIFYYLRIKKLLNWKNEMLYNRLFKLKTKN
jgi:hypothetical protein